MRALDVLSLNGLGVSQKTIECLLKKVERINSGNETDEVQKLILWGRQTLPDINPRISTYIVEFLKALDEKGLIRHDFASFSLNMGRFYQDVFFGETTPYLVYRLTDFRTNEAYETYKNASWGDYTSLLGAIQDILDDDVVAQSVILYYGLEDGVPHTLKEVDECVGARLGASFIRVRNGMAKIKGHKEMLPELFDIKDRVSTTVSHSGRPFYEFAYGDPLMYRDKTGRKALELLKTL